MDVRGLSHAGRVKEWEDRIRTCRSSGLSVSRWCEENQINTKTYYKWERICLTEAAQRLGYTGNSLGLIRIDPSKLPAENHAPVLTSEATAAELIIRCGQVSLEINSEMPVARIAELVSALNSHV